MTTPRLLSQEGKFLAESDVCTRCGHLVALHSYHCCEYCMIPECPCAGFAGSRPQRHHSQQCTDGTDYPNNLECELCKSREIR